MAPTEQKPAMIGVAVVAIASFGLGTFNDRFLTSHDFVISGNHTPASCNGSRSPGQPLGRLLETVILSRKPLQGMSPCSCAYAAAAVRDGTFSLVKILLRCRSTVF